MKGPGQTFTKANDGKGNLSRICGKFGPKVLREFLLREQIELNDQEESQHGQE